MNIIKKEFNRDFRINLIFGFFCFIIAIFLIKLFSIQVLKHGTYVAQAQDQYWNLSVIPATRGDIITSDGFVLAGTQTHYLLYAEPKKIINKYETAHELAKILQQIRIDDNKLRPQNSLAQTTKNDEKIIKKNNANDDQFSNSMQNGNERAFLNISDPVGSVIPDDQKIFDDYYNRILSSLDRDLFWVVLDHNISPVDKKKIEDSQLKGIGFEEEPVRYYPEGALAAHVLGYVAFNEKGEKQGYFGIEGSLDGDLKGKSGRVLEERDALGNPILVGGYKKSEPVKGRDIVLTINRAVQFIVEKKLKDSVEKFDAKSGSVIIMDPFTGDIISMANYPTYEPDNLFVEPTDEDIPQDDEKIADKRKLIEMKNLCISEIYEPGSVIKPLTVSSAIELGKVNPETTFDDKGPATYSDYTINNWDGKHYGIQTIRQLLEKSNNIGAAWVGHQVGAQQLANYFRQFGLGTKTDVDLEGEDTGQIHDYKDWTDIDTATAAFGQGISATPLQVLNAFNVIANGGFLVQPKIISKIIDENGVIEIPTKQIRRVISKQTSETMIGLLKDAAENGEAKFFILKNYDVAGKTGTAQIPVNGKYHPDKTNATFVGFLPATKRFSMIVKLEEPKKSIYAAETAAPLWMEITNELVKYYGLTPDKK